jgi:hypothetical protein
MSLSVRFLICANGVVQRPSGRIYTANRAALSTSRSAIRRAMPDAPYLARPAPRDNQPCRDADPLPVGRVRALISSLVSASTYGRPTQRGSKLVCPGIPVLVAEDLRSTSGRSCTPALTAVNPLRRRSECSSSARLVARTFSRTSRAFPRSSRVARVRTN